MSLNFENAYKSFPDRITAIIYGDNTTATAANCIYGVVSNQEAEPSAGVYSRYLVSFFIPTASINFTPATGDKLSDGYNLWTIYKIDEPTWNCLWELSCVRLEFQGKLKDTVSILQATGSSTITGARSVVYSTLASNIAAAIEPREQKIENIFDTIASPQYFDIYLDNDVAAANNPTIIKAGALIQDQNNYLYEIKEITDRERLDLATHVLGVKQL